MDMRLDKLPFVCRPQKLLYYYRLRDMLSAYDEVALWSGVKYWYFDKVYTSMYFFDGSTQRTGVLEFEISQSPSVCKTIFVG